MNKYKVKTEVVDACQFDDIDVIKKWLNERGITYMHELGSSLRDVIKVPVAPFGVLQLLKGDWIILSRKGVLESLPDEDFKVVFEPL